jgi:hypothetical protein
MFESKPKVGESGKAHYEMVGRCRAWFTKSEKMEAQHKQ